MSPPALTGTWKGHLVVDALAVRVRLHSAQEKKLVLYAISRLKAASFVLLLKPDRSYDYRFDDGYPPDREWHSGNWIFDGRTVLLQGWTTGTLQNANLRIPFHRAAGIAIELMKSPKPAPRP